jgi:hypothetical protein
MRAFVISLENLHRVWTAGISRSQAGVAGA